MSDSARERTRIGASASGAFPDFVVVMGIAGTGKTEIAQWLAKAQGASFLEADVFHSAANVERMRNGIGLSDEERWPWLNAVCDAALTEPRPVIIACSVLKRRYRDLFRHRLGELRLLFLHGTVELIAARLGARKNHFASISLLESQVRTLEPPTADEDAIAIDVAEKPERIVEFALQALQAGKGKEQAR
jgi:gluconokinase